MAPPFQTLHQSVLLLSLPGYEIGASWVNAGHSLIYEQVCLYHLCKLVRTQIYRDMYPRTVNEKARQEEFRKSIDEEETEPFDLCLGFVLQDCEVGT